MNFRSKTIRLSPTVNDEQIGKLDLGISMFVILGLNDYWLVQLTIFFFLNNNNGKK